MGETSPYGRPLRLAYLALEAPAEGQAAHTHIHEMIDGLRRLDVVVEPFLATRTGAAAGRSYAVRLVDYLRVQARLALALRRYDAVYVRSHFMALPVVVVARLLGVPVYHEINGRMTDVAVTYPAFRALARLIGGLQRWQYRLASGLFAVTPQLAQWAKAESGHDRVYVVPNGANTEMFRPDGDKTIFDRPYAVFVGGLVAWHGIGTMVAAAQSAQWPHGVDLVIAGDGVERDSVRQAAAAGQVKWLGRVPYADVPALLRGALAALVATTNPQGRSDTGVLPLKLYEALACGTPVVVTDLPAQKDLVLENGAGLIIPADDADALAAAVGAIAGNRDAFAAKAAQMAAIIARDHDWRARAKAVRTVIAGSGEVSAA